MHAQALPVCTWACKSYPEYAARLDIGQRADCEGDAVLDEIFYKRLILHALHAVVDAVHLQQAQGLPDVLRGPFLACAAACCGSRMHLAACMHVTDT